MSNTDAFFSRTLADTDPEIFGAIEKELGRQRHEIELIASENIVSRAVLEAQGTIMTNKYAGHPASATAAASSSTSPKNGDRAPKARRQLNAAQFARREPPCSWHCFVGDLHGP
jgi:hypothetical protein